MGLVYFLWCEYETTEKVHESTGFLKIIVKNLNIQGSRGKG